jgi:DNA polymerase-3 subunit chi
LLWTWQATGFLPHCAPHDALAGETPVLIAAGEETPEGFGVLLNLSTECPPHFERFERLCELVGRDDDEKAAGRGRYRYYRDRGYRITDHDLARE